jgi:eukaryotic-like serine/threonine-protein kinase
MNDEKFMIPEDNDATKAIPIITNDRPYGNLDETIVHGKEQHNVTEPSTIKQDASKGKKEKKKRKKWPIILVSVFLILLILGISAVTILPDILAPDEVEIPDVAGMELEEAEHELEQLGFVIGDTIEMPDDEIEEGLVIRTDPKAGRLYKEGTTVDLYVSTGKDAEEVLDYTGRAFDDVLNLLKDDYKDVKIKEELYHDEIPAGHIIEQSISPGEKVVFEETIIEFTVSKGPEVIKLKDLSDFNARGLDEYASSNGLVIDYSKEEYHDTVKEGLVIRQEPKAGTELKKGDKVTVTLSKGKKVIPPKEVVVDVFIPYEPEVEGEPQQVQIYIEDMNRDIETPVYSFEIFEPTTRELTLTVTHDGKASYKVVVNGNAIIEKPVPYPAE